METLSPLDDQPKKRPGWATGIGITMIILGFVAITMSFYRMAIPEMAGFQKKIFNGMEETMNPYVPEGDTVDFADEEMDRVMGEIWGDDTSGRKIYWLGLFGMFLYLLYLFGGVFLLVPKKFTVSLVMISLVGSILLQVLTFILLQDVSGLVTMVMKNTVFIGIPVDLVVLIIFITSNRSFYQESSLLDDQLN